MNVCDSCFQDQRSLNDQFKQITIDAQTLANRENKSIAVIAEGGGWRLEIITKGIPPGTCKVVNPVR